MYEDIFERAFKGDAQAQYEIGDKFYNGDHVPQSYESALSWYRKSAAQGNYWGLFNVAKCYENGHGVAANRDEAIEHYRRACAAGLPTGWDTDWARVRLNELAPGTQAPSGASPNHSSASSFDANSIRLLRMNALAGSAEAQYQLGDAYYDGTGVERSFKEAFNWYRRSAYQKNHWGQFNVGKCYDLGHGVTQNVLHAAYWYMLSAEQGNDCSRNAFERIFRQEIGYLPYPAPYKKRGIFDKRETVHEYLSKQRGTRFWNEQSFMESLRSDFCRLLRVQYDLAYIPPSDLS